MGEDQSDDREVDGPITLRILDGIAWDFAQAKWWRWWKTVRCGGLIPATLTEKLQRRKKKKKKICANQPGHLANYLFIYFTTKT